LAEDFVDMRDIAGVRYVVDVKTKQVLLAAMRQSGAMPAERLSCSSTSAGGSSVPQARRAFYDYHDRASGNGHEFVDD
jgi:hypothetical protein